jgi:O-antigen/teichoic acid export membrane protein
MSSSPPSQSTDDGRERFGRNVAFAWGGYMVNVISGFLVPRLISDQLGQATLGVWDFAWSFVSYFGLVQLGMGGSIGRYVALHRAKNDAVGLSRSVSTIAIFQRSVGWLALVLALVSAWWILPLFGARLAESMNTARWVLLLLGTEIALSISLSVYGAVIVGCHRWDLHNSVSAVTYGLVAVGMIGGLLLGGGLPGLALVHCTIMTGAELVRLRVAFRICPELRIERRLASWTVFKEQARYSVKSLIPSISNLLSNQALSLLITAFLGPASLAVFSRSRALMTTLQTLTVKFGMIVIPTASALQAKNDQQALRITLLTTAAIISSLALPILIAIGVLGDSLIRLWMGDTYVLHGLVAILCVGTYATLVQEPVWSLLSGMNLHGRVALAKLGAAVGSALLLTAGLWFLHWGLLGAAVCFALPQLLIDGLVTPWYACHLLGVSKRLFLWQVFLRPICCVLPFAITLGSAAILFTIRPLEAFGTMILGCLLSAWAYSTCLVSPKIKKRFALSLRCMHLKRPVAPQCGPDIR